MELRIIDKLKDWAERYIFDGGINEPSYELPLYVAINKVLFIIRNKDREIIDVRPIKSDRVGIIDRRYFSFSHEDIGDLKIESMNYYEDESAIIVHLKEKSKVCQRLGEEEKNQLLSDIKEKENKDFYNN